MNPFTIEHILTFLSGVSVGVVALTIAADIHTRRSPSIADKCQQLGAIADRVLVDLQQRHNDDESFRQEMSGAAVNWADLTSWASYVVGEDGDSVWRVTVSEAAPDAWQFAFAIRAGIQAYDKDGLFYPLEVVTEW